MRDDLDHHSPSTWNINADRVELAPHGSSHTVRVGSGAPDLLVRGSLKGTQEAINGEVLIDRAGLSVSRVFMDEAVLYSGLISGVGVSGDPRLTWILHGYPLAVDPAGVRLLAVTRR